MKKIPVTILTGFLGSGKTTLLNHILTYEHGKKVAVIVNEIGPVGIDNQLIVSTNEEIVEMTNGCICCTIREDLLVALRKLLKSNHDFDSVLIETTGLANPGPIIGTFFLDPSIEGTYTVDGIVTVVDAYHMEKHLHKGMEATEQIAFSDIILLNKVDLLDKGEESIKRELLQTINPTATIISCENCEVDIEQIMTIGTFGMKEKLQLSEGRANISHLHGISSFVLRENEPLDMAKLNNWITAVVSELGENLYRYKGILYVEGVDRRVVFQGVHSMFAGTMDRPWKDGEEKKSELVFIGKDLNKEWFQEHLHQCVVE